MKRNHFILCIAFISFLGTSASAAVWQVAAPADFSSTYNNASFVSGDVIELTTDGGTYTFTKISTVSKSFTLRKAADVAIRPTITLGAGVAMSNTGSTGLDVVSITMDGLDFNGAGVATGLTQAKCQAGGDMIITMNNCIVRNMAATSNIFAYAVTGTGWVAQAKWYGDLTVTNSQFIGTLSTVMIITTGKFGGPNNMNFTNCYVKNGTGTVIGNGMGTENTTASCTINHVTFDNCGGATGTEFNVKNGGTSVTIVKNCVFTNNPGGTANKVIAVGTNPGNVNNTNNAVYYLGSTPAIGVKYPTALLGTYGTLNPALDATYYYASEPTYLTAGADGKSIGYHPVLTITVATEGDVSTVLKNSTLQFSATVTDSLSAFSPSVSWSTNAANGSTIDAVSGLFTAGATDESNIIVTATSDYGYVSTKTISVSSTTNATNLNKINNQALYVVQNGKKFIVKGVTNNAYSVYSLNGCQVASGLIKDGNIQLNNLNQGIYLLKTNGQVAKFVVR